jgi:hypothetical protein
MGIMREFDGESAHASTRFGIWMAALDSSDGYAQPAIFGDGPGRLCLPQSKFRSA